MTQDEILLIKASWKQLQKIEAVLIGDAFYSKLFLEAPYIRPLFKSSRVEQGNKLIATLAILVKQLEKPDQLTHAIEQLAIRHVQYGVKPEHYELVGNTLLWTLGKLLGNSWNSALQQAWTNCYTALSGTMIRAAYVSTPQ
ncbi:MAG TPA: globin domain-containing protein [Chitinophagaceae bacterium]